MFFGTTALCGMKGIIPVAGSSNVLNFSISLTCFFFPKSGAEGHNLFSLTMRAQKPTRRKGTSMGLRHNAAEKVEREKEREEAWGGENG
jgi:hypothetical protein